MNLEMKALVIICGGLIGLFLLPNAAVCQEFGVELAYPVSESSTAGLMLSSDHTFTILTVLYIYIYIVICFKCNSRGWK